MSNHPYLAAPPTLATHNRVWSDSVLPHPELHAASGEDQQDTKDAAGGSGGSGNHAFLNNFDYVNPISPVRQKPKPKSFSRERFKELRARYHAKNPFHRKGTEVADDLGWTLDQEGICTGVAAGRLPTPPQISGGGSSAPAASSGPASNRVPTDGLPPLQSPMSIGGPVTPRGGGPDSVKAEGGGGGGLMSHPSPAPPLSNGPTTPYHNPKTPGTPGQPRTPGNPRSVNPPSASGPSVPASPYPRPTSALTAKLEPPSATTDSVKTEVTGGASPFPALPGSVSAVSDMKPVVLDEPTKRPSLPTKEYEVRIRMLLFWSIMQQIISMIYDY